MRVLVIRLSAMGDVALAAPVLTAINRQIPGTRIIFLTRKAFAPFFREGENLELFCPDLRGRHKGLTGIFRLLNDILSGGKVDHVVDLHDVLRTKLLRALFRIKGIPVSVIDKGRNEKRDLIRGRKKHRLKHTVERYRDAFADAGLPTEPVRERSVFVSAEAEKRAAEILSSTDVLNIGVAPYARHALKRWPEENMISLLNLIACKHKARFLLFGGPDEKEKLDNFSGKVPVSVNLSGKLTLEQELAVIAGLDFMISMDSSNMHMAALSGTRVISIWGGTDPFNGFGAWMQPDEYSIRIPVGELDCRPCTVYGKGKCRRGDLACMNWLTPEKVYRKIDDAGLLNK